MSLCAVSQVLIAVTAYKAPSAMSRFERKLIPCKALDFDTIMGAIGTNTPPRCTDVVMQFMRPSEIEDEAKVRPAEVAVEAAAATVAAAGQPTRQYWQYSSASAFVRPQRASAAPHRHLRCAQTQVDSFLEFFEVPMDHVFRKN